MKRTRIWLLLAGLGLSLGGSCGEATSLDELGGETHWLKSCDPNGAEECGPNLECVCGVCSRACTEDASCGAISSQARCAARETTSYASSCAASAPARLCVRAESPAGDAGNGTPVYGRRYDARGCFGDRELAGYALAAPEERVCSDAETHASNGPDTCWLFPSSCVPDGFEPIPLVDVAGGCTTVRDLCPDLLSCNADQVATVKGCSDCYGARLMFSSAVNQLAESFESCNSDVDCTTHEWQTGCDTLCPVAVNASSVELFDAAVTDLSAGYCADAADWRATCGLASADCNTVPLCRAGRCVISGVACADRSLANCEADGDCVLASAFPYDTQGQCFAAAPVTVACVDPDLSCPPSIRAALNGDGNCYAFGNCLPAGFQQAPDDHICNAAITATCEG